MKKNKKTKELKQWLKLKETKSIKQVMKCIFKEYVCKSRNDMKSNFLDCSPSGFKFAMNKDWDI